MQRKELFKTVTLKVSIIYFFDINKYRNEKSHRYSYIYAINIERQFGLRFSELLRPISLKKKIRTDVCKPRVELRS